MYETKAQTSSNPDARKEGPAVICSVEQEYTWLRGAMDACEFGKWTNDQIQSLIGGSADRILSASKNAVPLAKADLRQTIIAKGLSSERLESLVAGVLDQFPEDLRLLVALINKEHLTFAEAADVLGKSLEHVQSEYCKSLIGLRIGLERAAV